MLVSAVALVDPEHRVLMQQRALAGSHGGLWEFPGGKVEPGETPEQALVREIEEELGITLNPVALHAVGFASGAHQSGRPIVLLLYACREWSGEPQCLEGEAIAWFAPETLGTLEMPPLDVPLVAALRRML